MLHGKITNLIDAVHTRDTITLAKEAIRKPIEKVRPLPECNTLNIKLISEQAALKSLGVWPKDKHTRAHAEGVHVTLVAGAGFAQEPTISRWI